MESALIIKSKLKQDQEDNLSKNHNSVVLENCVKTDAKTKTQTRELSLSETSPPPFVINDKLEKNELMTRSRNIFHADQDEYPHVNVELEVDEIDTDTKDPPDPFLEYSRNRNANVEVEVEEEINIDYRSVRHFNVDNPENTVSVEIFSSSIVKSNQDLRRGNRDDRGSSIDCDESNPHHESGSRVTVAGPERDINIDNCGVSLKDECVESQVSADKMVSKLSTAQKKSDKDCDTDMSSKLPPLKSFPSSEGMNAHNSQTDADLKDSTVIKPYRCHCGTQFKKRKYFIEHLKTHKSGKRFECHICGKILFQQRSYIGHLKVHTSGKPYLCVTCGKRFSYKASYNFHMKSHENKDSDEKTCATKSILRDHTKIHTGEERYKCHTCGKEYAHKATFQKHSRSHYIKQQSKCLNCGEVFDSDLDFEVHSKMHIKLEPYSECSCGETFIDVKSSIKHKLSHIREMQYKCVLCGEVFGSYVDIEVHTKIHARDKANKHCNGNKTFALRHRRNRKGDETGVHGGNPFECLTCGEVFDEYRALQRHMRVAHYHRRKYTRKLRNSP